VGGGDQFFGIGALTFFEPSTERILGIRENAAASGVVVPTDLFMRAEAIIGAALADE
jgi:hypothetical protein